MNDARSGHAALNLPALGLSLRVLFTGYLLVVSLGLITSGLQILFTHGMADGQLGLSVDDVVYSYYGDRGGSRLEVKLDGTMKDKADVAERAAIVRWVEQGSTREQWDAEIKPIFDKNCVRCHGAIPGLADFRTYEGVKPKAEVDMGASVQDLTRVSHIHLFGIAFIFFFVCLIFSLSVGVPRLLKATAIGFPFLFLCVDISAWWLTHWWPSFAWATIVGGIGYNLAAAFMILTSLYQMWILPRRGVHPQANAWLEE